LRDVPIDAIHVGALVDAQSVRAVARALAGLVSVPIVCDPVITATTGDRLADDATVAALRDELFAHCTVVTPNLDEAGQLVGRAIVDEESMEGAARELLGTGAGAVLLKGGHLVGPASDILVDRSGVVRFVGDRIETTLRGTGDLLACAIAARFADGEALVPSVESARSFVRGCLAAGVPFAGTRTIP
jgi:hydroxymethylpyrimidine/phosphomethylpyrimidine kinase